MAEHAGCPAKLRETWALACAQVGDSEPAEITVSTETPIVSNPYVTGLQCPHGVTFWIEPTSEQIARWRQDARHG